MERNDSSAMTARESEQNNRDSYRLFQAPDYDNVRYEATRPNSFVYSGDRKMIYYPRPKDFECTRPSYYIRIEKSSYRAAA